MAPSLLPTLFHLQTLLLGCLCRPRLCAGLVVVGEDAVQARLQARHGAAQERAPAALALGHGVSVWERVGGRESVYMYACVRVCPESCLAIIRDSPFAGDRS